MKNRFILNYWILEIGNVLVFEEIVLYFGTIRLKAEIGFLKQAPFNLGKKKKAYLCVCVYVF